MYITLPILKKATEYALLTMYSHLQLFLFIHIYKYFPLEWSREVLLEKWMKDPVECCQLAGVQAPSSVLHHGNSLDSNTSPDSNEDAASCPELTVRYIFSISEEIIR